MSDATALNVHLTDRGLLLDDGGFIGWPDCDGTLHRFDKFGRPIETIAPGDDEHEHWFKLFPHDVVEIDYAVVYRATLRLPRGRYQLQNELANVTPLEDACHKVLGSPTVRQVKRNGQLLSVPVEPPTGE